MHSYDRRPGRRRPSSCILIVCEGAETEPNYFRELRNFLKLPTIKISIQARAGAPVSVVEKAINLVEKRKSDFQEGRTNAPIFDEVWCVFDVENPHHNQSFDQAVRKARDCGYAIAVSNPAFEFWYILHFERTTRPFANGKEVKTYLCQYIPGYLESLPVFNQLIGSINQAIRHARDILDNLADDQPFPNPSTQVHLLVKEMIDMSPSGREHFGE